MINPRGHLELRNQYGLRECPPVVSLKENDFSNAVLWVQIHGLPLEYMTKAKAEKIAQGISTFLEVDTGGSNTVMCKQALRMRIELEVAEPLVPGFFLNRPTQPPVWIQVRYKGLSEFFF